MKSKKIQLALGASLLLCSSAFATNGAVLIGIGAQSIGMGGTGIAYSHGAESALLNPALITSVDGTEITFGGTLFTADVESNVYGEGFYKSEMNPSVIPSVAIAHNFGDGISAGVGMHGVGGMGVDYRDVNNQMTNNYLMTTNLQLMQFTVPLAYKHNGLSLSVDPILQYGALDMNFDGSSTRGVATDFGYGFALGSSYEYSNFTVGAVYKSAIDMQYNGVISQAMSDFTGQMPSGEMDHLEQPSEMGLGLSYKLQNHGVALDYKRINWADVKGYKDFGWESQNVFAVGYEYSEKDWSLRTGFNYAKSPIVERALMPMSPMVNSNLSNMLNLLAFPATTTSHYTMGGSYNINEQLSLDLAFMYAPKVTETFRVVSIPVVPLDLDVTTTHSQHSTTAQLRFKF